MAGRNDRATICVVLVSHGGSDVELRSFLAERSGAAPARHVVECDDAALALAELCLADRAERSRSVWGLDHAAPAQLVVVEPAHRADWPELRGALRQYLPRVELLSWSGGRLRAMDEPAAPPATPAPPAPPAPRLAVPPAPDAAVTGDEIAMLLERQAEEGS